MTRRKPWEKVLKDFISKDNDGNDFFYEWTTLKENSLDDLFEEYLGVSYGQRPVIIKVRKGAILIVTEDEEIEKEF